MGWFLFIIFVFLVLAVVVFNFGPGVVEWFFDTLEEWEDVIESARDEK